MCEGTVSQEVCWEYLRVFWGGGGGSLGGSAQIGQAGAQGLAAVEGARGRSRRLQRCAIRSIACALQQLPRYSLK